VWLEVVKIPPLTYKQKRSKALKEKHEQLDFEQPFTQREKKGLGKQNMAFIRDIQISRRISKDEAIELYAASNSKGKKALNKLMKETKTKIKDHYNQKRQYKISTEKDFEAPIKNAQKRRKAKEEKIFKGWLRNEKKELRMYLASVKYRGTPTYNKVKSGHKKYPDATKYELTHGINSKASKNFRVKHGLEPEYSGKVNK
jgi:hypothetical protein